MLSYSVEGFDSAFGATGEDSLVAQWRATARRSLPVPFYCEYHHRLLPITQAHGQVDGEGAYTPGDTSSLSDAPWHGCIAGGLQSGTLASVCGSAVPGSVHGGVSGDIEGEEEEENEYEDNGDEGGGGAAVSTERAGWDGMVIHGPSMPETSAEDAPPGEGEEVRAGEHLRRREQLMTASKPDMSPHHERNWTFEFDMDSWEETPVRLTDADTDTSVASEDTWRPRNLGCPHGLEDHEVGPTPRSNPGPPFAVGDVIMCDAPGHLLGTIDTRTRLQRAFVLKADHPRYRL